MVCRSMVSFFFFSSRRRHTRLVSDWSSDVCSSDLGIAVAARERRPPGAAPDLVELGEERRIVGGELHHLGEIGLRAPDRETLHLEIGRASCREKCKSRGWREE